MNEMIDRVARAIMVEQGCGLTIEGEHVFCCDPRASDPRLQCECKMAARAAIAAMREPTTDMVVAGTEQWLCEAAMEDRSEVNWRAMIDEALREEGA